MLVGDPQQLPATVLSTAAAAAHLERSLFERLALPQVGWPVKLLSVQYRMAPAIRAFPSDYFYGGKLVDGASVRERPPPGHHGACGGLLGPFRFFDVAGGREQRAGTSLRNRAEARLIGALVAALAAAEPSVVAEGRVVVLTPYQQQAACLREELGEALGSGSGSGDAASAALVRSLVRTVDSFQGQERDVVLLSCVRADARRGIGFVADIRRLNVALTRAKASLWVVGSAEALRGEPCWAALVDHAQTRGSFVAQATPEMVRRATASTAPQSNNSGVGGQRIMIVE